MIDRNAGAHFFPQVPVLATMNMKKKVAFTYQEQLQLECAATPLTLDTEILRRACDDAIYNGVNISYVRVAERKLEKLAKKEALSQQLEEVRPPLLTLPRPSPHPPSASPVPCTPRPFPWPS